MINEVHVVFGYMNTGSGSLTYPDDFETVGFYEDKVEAQEHVDRLNKENGYEEDDYDYDGMVYEVDTLKNLKTVKK